jgi:hypothetical protein
LADVVVIAVDVRVRVMRNVVLDRERKYAPWFASCWTQNPIRIVAATRPPRLASPPHTPGRTTMSVVHDATQRTRATSVFA